MGREDKEKNRIGSFPCMQSTIKKTTITIRQRRRRRRGNCFLLHQTPDRSSSWISDMKNPVNGRYLVKIRRQFLMYYRLVPFLLFCKFAACPFETNISSPESLTRFHSSSREKVSSLISSTMASILISFLSKPNGSSS